MKTKRTILTIIASLCLLAGSKTTLAAEHALMPVVGNDFYNLPPALDIDNPLPVQAAKRGHKRKADANEQHLCKMCNKPFGSARNKNKHERAVHGRSPIKQEEKAARAGKLQQYDPAVVAGAVNAFKKSTPNNKGQAQPLTCKLCGHHAIATKPTFLRHIKSHDMQKNFECAFCPEVFTAKSSVKEHVRKKHPENAQDSE